LFARTCTAILILARIEFVTKRLPVIDLILYSSKVKWYYFYTVISDRLSLA
jgi:hypothetical protein